MDALSHFAKDGVLARLKGGGSPQAAALRGKGWCAPATIERGARTKNEAGISIRITPGRCLCVRGANHDNGSVVPLDKRGSGRDRKLCAAVRNVT